MPLGLVIERGVRTSFDSAAVDVEVSFIDAWRLREDAAEFAKDIFNHGEPRDLWRAVRISTKDALGRSEICCDLGSGRTMPREARPSKASILFRTPAPS